MVQQATRLIDEKKQVKDAFDEFFAKEHNSSSNLVLLIHDETGMRRYCYNYGTVAQLINTLVASQISEINGVLNQSSET